MEASEETAPGVAFVQYLNAKRSIDDRALNRTVFASVQPYLQSTAGTPVRLLEIGAGVGTMIERLLDWQALTHTRYTAVDSDGSLLELAEGRLAQWANAHQSSLHLRSDGVDLRGPRGSLTVDLVTEEIGAFLAQAGRVGRFDIVLAHAVLDLLDLEHVLPAVERALAPGGHVYFTINFDGHTVFEPAVDRELDRRIIDAYHATMDERLIAGKRAGHSQTGRNLLVRLPVHGFELVSVGPSDWVIHPQSDGYRGDDIVLLKWMLQTVEKSLAGKGAVAERDLQRWLRLRRGQLADNQLVFIAHQLDIHARRRG